MKMYLTLLILFIVPQISFSGNEGAHGGLGVKAPGGAVVLLDLLEFGVDQGKNEEILQVPVDPACLATLEKILPKLEADTGTEFCRKLTEIRWRDSLFAESILMGMILHRWQFLDRELRKVEEATPLIKIALEDLVQVAVRTQLAILISLPEWKKMNNRSRSALLYHEVIYSLVAQENGKAKSARVRELTAFLFIPKAPAVPSWWPQWKEIIGRDLPILENFLRLKQFAEPLDIPLPGYVSERLGMLTHRDFNVSFFARDSAGPVYIGFSPYVTVKYSMREQRIQENPLLTRLQSTPVPLREFEGNFSRLARRLCQPLRFKHGISKLIISFSSHSLGFEKDSAQQRVMWTENFQPKTFYQDTVEARSLEFCEQEVLRLTEAILGNLRENVSKRGEFWRP